MKYDEFVNFFQLEILFYVLPEIFADRWVNIKICRLACDKKLVSLMRLQIKIFKIFEFVDQANARYNRVL
jgi:hypothetical protein